MAHPTEVVNALTAYNKNLMKQDRQKYMGCGSSEDIAGFGYSSRADSTEDVPSPKDESGDKSYSSEEMSIRKTRSSEDLTSGSSPPPLPQKEKTKSLKKISMKPAAKVGCFLICYFYYVFFKFIVFIMFFLNSLQLLCFLNSYYLL